MKKYFTKTALAACLASVLLTGAQAEELLEHQIVSGRLAGVYDGGSYVIDELELNGGQRVQFVAEPHGVGVLEVGPKDAVRLIPQLLAEQRTTALEMYERLSDDPAPVELLENHDAILDNLSDDLRATRQTQQLFDVTAEPNVSLSGIDSEDVFNCAYNDALIGGSPWASDWYFEHSGADQRDQETYAYYEIQPGEYHTWSAGESVQRWLGVCNGDRLSTPSPSFRFYPEYRHGNNWLFSISEVVSPAEQVSYYSSSVGERKYRIRLSVDQWVGMYKTLGVGVAINHGSDSGDDFQQTPPPPPPPPPQPIDPVLKDQDRPGDNW